MKYHIVADSSCDLFTLPGCPPDADFSTVPFSITIGEKTFIDDETMSVSMLLDANEQRGVSAHTACPSAHDWAERFSVPLEVLSSFRPVPGTAIRPLPLPPEKGRLTAATEHGGLVTLVGTHIRSLPSPADRARAAMERAGLPVRSSLETDDRLSVQTDPELGTEALRCLHKAFFE